MIKNTKAKEAAMETLVFLDVETTGLNGYRDRVVEIYMLKVSDSGNVEEYHTMINPERAIPKEITSLTGITDDDVRHAPREQDAACAIREFIGEAIVVAHNLDFDRRFLVSMFKRNNCRPLHGKGIDTLEISRQLFPKLCIYPGGEGSHKLRNLMYHFRLDREFANSHRAKDDVLLLVQVYRHLEAYARGMSPIRYPRAMTHGCPQCRSAMRLVVEHGKRELICVNGTSCNQRLVV
ncbi:MAG TPA: 3'-5' exonuclease [Limnochordia bacterium]|nr:3'-5' exonuclease [Limnochordia bacterium]